MANKLYEENDIQNIANAIRNKNGSQDTYTVSEMATAINNIPAGTDTSDATATESDIVSGKTAYVNGEKITGLRTSDSFYVRDTSITDADLLDIFSKVNCEANSYNYAFASCRNLTEINTSSTLSILTSNSAIDVEGMFQACTNLERITGRGLNVSNVKNFSNMFHSCDSLQTVLFRGSTSKGTDFSYMFYACSNLTNIYYNSTGTAGRLDLRNAEDVTEMFEYCDNLSNIRISNLSITGLNLEWCVALLESDLNYLIENLVETTTPKTVTLGSTNLAKLSSSEIAIATSKGWTLA